MQTWEQLWNILKKVLKAILKRAKTITDINLETLENISIIMNQMDYTIRESLFGLKNDNIRYE